MIVRNRVYQLIRIIALGELPPGEEHTWSGWRFIEGKLWDPIDNRWHTPGSIHAWFWVSQQLDTLIRRENLQRQNAVQAGKNVIPLPTTRAGQTLRKALYKRLEDD